MHYRHAQEIDAEFIDRNLRAGQLGAVLDYGDAVLLQQGCGLSKRDLAYARMAWNGLQGRRQRRNRPRQRV